MRYLIILLLLCLCSCTTVKRAGELVCRAEEQVQMGVSNVGGFFGSPGSLVAGTVNLVLSSLCKSLEVVTNAPQDLADDLTAPFQPTSRQDGSGADLDNGGDNPGSGDSGLGHAAVGLPDSDGAAADRDQRP